MGNNSSQPTNKTGKKVLHQKIENSKKTGVLSLREHKLVEIPDQVKTLRTLDVSNNNLSKVDNGIGLLTDLKSFNCDLNKFPSGSLEFVTKLKKLQVLSAGGNKLGINVCKDKNGTAKPRSLEPLPKIPSSLKQLKIDNNSLQSVPRSIYTSMLMNLEKLDLSTNNIASISPEIGSLTALIELNLDRNCIVSLPEEIGKLVKLKVLSLRSNNINVDTTKFSSLNPQPLPSSIFTDTLVIDLNLHGNRISSTQLNEFDGFSSFLDRRHSVKSKGLYGGALTDLDMCGLE